MGAVMKIKPKPRFHPNAPKKLKQLWKVFRAYNPIAKYLDVNVAYVYNALVKGYQPINQDVRIKFGLPRKPRKPRTIRVPDKPPLPTHLRWWRQKLTKDQRDLIIQSEYRSR